jgi:hypothetical protein
MSGIAGVFFTPPTTLVVAGTGAKVVGLPVISVQLALNVTPLRLRGSPLPVVAI